MPDFMDEAKNLADQHSDMVDKGMNEATQDVENKTGGKFDSEIQSGEQQAEGFMGTGQQGQQDQGQQDQQGQQGGY